MAYKALYRSYRPQTFNEVAGQEHIITTLQNAIKENRIAHAYLFAGPRGTGKTTVAKLLAKALNCTGENPPCDHCPNCKAITSGEHPDVIEIDAASNNGVDEVRDLIDKVKYAPINGKYKVYIIDEVHMMSTGAFNALLKTLEEPPAHIVFVLATTEPHKILPTIISRCQRFDFKKVDDHDIVQRMQYVLDSENKQYDTNALNIIAKLADGGMRDALSILEQCLAYNNEVTVANVNEVYGLLSMDNKINFIKQLLSKNIKGVLDSLELMLSGSIDIKRLTFDLIDVLKDVIIYKNTQDTSILFVLTKEDIDKLVPYILVEEAFDIIDILIEASSHYSQSINADTYFELAMLKICNKIKDENKVVENVTKAVNINLDNKIDNNENNIINNITNEQIDDEINDTTIENQDDNIVENTTDDENDTANEIIDIDVAFEDILNILVQAKRQVLNEIKEKWPVIARYRFNLNTAKFASMLCDGNPVAAGDDAIILAFDHQPNVNEVNDTKNYYQLKNFLKDVLGSNFDFIAIKSSEWPNIRNKYIDLMKNKKLPEPQPITLKHIGQEADMQPTLNEAQSLALELFGDIVEFEE